MTSVNKAERPTLQGQRIKTRKRDEKEKHDPNGFRDSIITGINEIISNNGTGQLSLKTSLSSNSVSSLGNNNGQVKTESILDSPTVDSSPETEELKQVNENDGRISANGSLGVVVADFVTKARLEALSKFLDEGGSKKFDYRKYGEVLFDVLIAGGILAPGGTIVVDNESSRTSFCVFSCSSDDIDSIRGFAHVIVKLIRRYKYLEKSFEEEVKKILKFLKGFKPEERVRLAKLTGVLIAVGQVPVTVLSSVIHDQSVKDGCAGTFVVTVLSTWLQEKGKGEAAAVWSSMKKAGMDQKLLDFFPVAKRTPEYLETAFKENGLADLLVYQKAGLGDKAKKELMAQVSEMINGDSFKASDLSSVISEAVSKNKMPEHEVIVLLWNGIMNNSEWSKKEELVADQAIKRLTVFAPVLQNYTKSVKAELALINRVQEYSYDNMNFLKAFTKMIQTLYKRDVITEDAILKWYKECHSSKGKSVFLDQAKPFIEWLEAAEEESDED